MSGITGVSPPGPPPPPPPNIRRFPHVPAGLMLGGGGLRIAKTHPCTKVNGPCPKGRESLGACNHAQIRQQRAQSAMAPAVMQGRVVVAASCRRGCRASRAPTRSASARATLLSSVGVEQWREAAAEATALLPCAPTSNQLAQRCVTLLPLRRDDAARRKTSRPARRASLGACAMRQARRVQAAPALVCARICGWLLPPTDPHGRAECPVQ